MHNLCDYPRLDTLVIADQQDYLRPQQIRFACNEHAAVRHMAMRAWGVYSHRSVNEMNPAGGRREALAILEEADAVHGRNAPTAGGNLAKFLLQSALDDPGMDPKSRDENLARATRLFAGFATKHPNYAAEVSGLYRQACEKVLLAGRSFYPPALLLQLENQAGEIFKSVRPLAPAFLAARNVDIRALLQNPVASENFIRDRIETYKRLAERAKGDPEIHALATLRLAVLNARIGAYTFAWKHIPDTGTSSESEIGFLRAYAEMLDRLPRQSRAVGPDDLIQPLGNMVKAKDQNFLKRDGCLTQLEVCAAVARVLRSRSEKIEAENTAAPADAKPDGLLKNIFKRLTGDGADTRPPSTLFGVAAFDFDDLAKAALSDALHAHNVYSDRRLSEPEHNYADGMSDIMKKQLVPGLSDLGDAKPR